MVRVLVSQGTSSTPLISNSRVSEHLHIMLQCLYNIYLALGFPMQNIIEQALGFSYNPCRFTTNLPPDCRRACFRVRKVLEGIVYDTVALEGNPFTLPEVKTLIEGITVGGHSVEDAEQVINQADSWKELLRLVSVSGFELDKTTANALHALVARKEALTWGQFRDGAVRIAGTNHQPPHHADLPDIFESGISTLKAIENVHERAFLTFLFGALQQFYYDGNKRVSRLLMNGQLLQAGYDAVTVPAGRKNEFNERMLAFYDSHDATDMLGFLASCSLDDSLVYHPTAATRKPTASSRGPSFQG